MTGPDGREGRRFDDACDPEVATGCGLRWWPGAAVVLSGSSRVTAVVPKFAADSVVT